MHDVLAVMDAVGSRRAVLFGYSEGGPMALLMAATHPERVAVAGAVRRLREAALVGGLPVGADPRGAGGVHRRAGDRWDWEADARMRMPVGRRVHAAVVGAPDARLGDAVDGARADGHELPCRRPRRAARGPGTDAGAAPQRRRAVRRRGGQVHRRPRPRRPVRAARRRGPLRVRRPGPDPRCGRAVPRRRRRDRPLAHRWHWPPWSPCRRSRQRCGVAGADRSGRPGAPGRRRPAGAALRRAGRRRACGAGPDVATTSVSGSPWRRSSARRRSCEDPAYG